MGSLRTCNGFLAVTLSIQRMKQLRHREAKSLSQRHTGCALTRLQPQPPKGWDDRTVSPLGFRACTFEIPCAMRLCLGSSASPEAALTAYPPSPEHCTHVQGALLSLRLLNYEVNQRSCFCRPVTEPLRLWSFLKKGQGSRGSWGFLDCE